MIEREEILKGQTIDASLEGNLEKLLKALNKFRAVWGKPMIVTSGYRSPAHNALVGGAKRSNHMKCLAADFADPDESLDVSARLILNFWRIVVYGLKVPCILRAGAICKLFLRRVEKEYSYLRKEKRNELD